MPRNASVTGCTGRSLRPVCSKNGVAELFRNNLTNCELTSQVRKRRHSQPFRGHLHLVEWMLRKGKDWNRVCDRVSVRDGREAVGNPWRLPQSHRQSNLDSTSQAPRVRKWLGPKCNRGSQERSV